MSESLDIAIIGATGHVGKVLTAGLAETHEITLYARRPEVAAAFAAGISSRIAAEPLHSLGKRGHAALINCIGGGDPSMITSGLLDVYSVTALADELALNYLSDHPNCRLVNFSSGAAYCSDFVEPAYDGTPTALSAGHLRDDQHYGLAKLASEGRHRAAKKHAIIDVRLFSLFTRFIDQESGFLMNGVLQSLRSDSAFLTSPVDHVRDYVSPSDLVSLVDVMLGSAPANCAVDVYSAAPVGKFELLEELANQFGLVYFVDESLAPLSATGVKPAYYSTSQAAAAFGYTPEKTSLEAIVEELEELLAPQ